jgi:hypothetical protein
MKEEGYVPYTLFSKMPRGGGRHLQRLLLFAESNFPVMSRLQGVERVGRLQHKPYSNTTSLMSMQEKEGMEVVNKLTVSNRKPPPPDEEVFSGKVFSIGILGSIVFLSAVSYRRIVS